MPSAEIITIGTELLLGDTTDTNTPYIARLLRDNGVDVFRTATVGDNEERIAQAVRAGAQRADIIITTGGLGPTVDDATREAIALAMGVETGIRPELWEQIQARYQRYGLTPTENNRRQAYLPQGATGIENKVGTAPAFIAEIHPQKKRASNRSLVIALPGVPSEMEHLMETKILPFLQERFALEEIIKSRVLHTSGVGESAIDQRIADLERLSNPTVGMAAHAGQVDIRITAKADSESRADTLLEEVEGQLRERLDDWIYGRDDETLAGVALKALTEKGWNLAVLEVNLRGRLLRRLSGQGDTFAGGEVLSSPPSPEKLGEAVKRVREYHNAQVGLGAMLIPGEKLQTLHLVLQTPDGEQQVERTYGGPPKLAPLWTTNLSLDFLRKLNV